MKKIIFFYLFFFYSFNFVISKNFLEEIKDILYKINNLSNELLNLDYHPDDNFFLQGLKLGSDKKEIFYNFEKQKDYLIMVYGNNDLINIELSIINKDNLNYYLNQIDHTNNIIFFKTDKTDNYKIILNNKNIYKETILILIFKKEQKKIQIPISDLIDAVDTIIDNKSNDIEISEINDIFLYGLNIKPKKSYLIKNIKLNNKSNIVLIGAGQTISKIKYNLFINNILFNNIESNYFIYSYFDSFFDKNYDIEIYNNSPDFYGRGIILLFVL